ncbi:hypothetical protein F528_0177, partial [Neisseria meningitidis 992008]
MTIFQFCVFDFFVFAGMTINDDISIFILIRHI